jgi:DNA repair ATPase RecN
MERIMDLEKQYEDLFEHHQKTQQAYWRVEDELEKIENKETNEEEFVAEIISLKKKIVFLKRQISNLRCKYLYPLITTSHSF